MNKLRRSRSNRVIAGVCGGLGDFFGIDPFVIRLIFLITGGLGGVYLILWIFLPENSSQKISSKPLSLGKIFLILIIGFPILIFLFYFLQAFLISK